MVMGIECKSYTENAMLKRIMVDFTLLKSVVPNINCVLLQLESQMTGDYSEPLKKIIYGSHSTHTIMSYFDVDLNIITLLEGERKVDEPIHNSKNFKDLKKDVLELGIDAMSELLKKYLRPPTPSLRCGSISRERMKRRRRSTHENMPSRRSLLPWFSTLREWAAVTRCSSTPR